MCGDLFTLKAPMYYYSLGKLLRELSTLGSQLQLCYNKETMYGFTFTIKNQIHLKCGTSEKNILIYVGLFFNGKLNRAVIAYSVTPAHNSSKSLLKLHKEKKKKIKIEK